MSDFRYIMNYIFYLIILMLFSVKMRASYGKYPIHNFTPDEYRAGIQNIDFAQNRDMTLFVANNLGVLAFNGNDWTTHDYKTGKKKRSLAFDENLDRLYVGSQGDFGFFESDWKYVSLLDLIPEAYKDFDEVWEVLLLNDKVYFCTFQTIFIYDGKSIQVIKHPGGLERTFLSNGRLFTQSQQGELFEIEGQNLIRTYKQNQKEQTIAGIIPYEGGYLLFYNSGQIEWSTLMNATPAFEDLIQVLEGTYVNHVLQLSDTRLAIATQTAGLLLYDTQERIFEKISTKDGLGSNACLRSFQDYFGNLWVGMQNGIALIHINSPMRLINQDIELEGSGYEAFETKEATYFTTSNGIYYYPKGEAKSIFLEGTEGPAYGIQEIAGRLYAGHHTGLFLLEGRTATRLSQTEGLWRIKQLRSNPQYAIAGTYAGLFLFQLDDNQYLRPLHKIKGFNSSSRFFEEDQAGDIWVSQYYKGLYQLKLTDDMQQALVQSLADNSLSEGLDQVILGQAKGDFYLGTYTGLFQLDPANAKINQASIFSDDIGKQPIYLFKQDRKNNIHVIAENAVGFFKQISTNNYQFVPSSLYQFRYHLNNDLLQSSINTDQGILFSANEGFIHYLPDLENPVKIEKPLLVKSIFSVTENESLYEREVFGARPDQVDPFVLRPKDRVIKITLESFEFNNLNNQQFRYYLKGLDDEFSEWTNVPSKEYSNLKEGQYEFVAETKNYLGEIRKSAPLVFRQKPPFYRSLMAKIFYVLLSALSLVMVLRLQRRRYKRITQKLEEDKELAVLKNQKKLDEIEQQKERELLQLKEEKIQSELQHVNNLLAASTMNLVVKNEFIESIKEELKDLRQKEIKPVAKQAVEKIVKEIDINLRIQEDWEQFEYHFDRVHGGFLNRLRNNFPNLSPNEQKLCAFLRLNLNTKEIANLLSISLRGVEVARYRLRKKLDLETGQNLSKFILEY